MLFSILYWIVPMLFAGAVLAEPNSSPPLATNAPVSSKPTPADSITAAYWNIQWFPGRRPNATRSEEFRQVSSVQQDISKLKADFIGLEEVRDFRSATIAVAGLPGFKVDVCSNFPPHEGQDVAQQIAIASRLQSMSAWAEEWKPSRGAVAPRGFAFAAYEIAPRNLLLVYAVHLKSNRGGLRENIVIRQESIRQLLAHMHAMANAYGKLGALSWIIGGDFNTAPDDPKFAGETTTRALRAGGFNWVWENVPTAARITLPPDRLYPAACFDHVFYRGAFLRRAWVASTSAQSSDHRAIEAIFDLPNATR